MSAVISLRMSDDIKSQIDNLAKISNRRKSDMLLTWINEKLELERWQIEEINQGIKEADAGLFASEEERNALRLKWLG
jgi:RHH-type rel operon transcriptional repressor/antitoxin RelB